jgi:hypothetical protein
METTDFEYTLTREALRQIKAEAWDEGYAAALGYDIRQPARARRFELFYPSEGGFNFYED